MCGQVKMHLDGLWSERLAQSREHAPGVVSVGRFQDVEAVFCEVGRVVIFLWKALA